MTVLVAHTCHAEHREFCSDSLNPMDETNFLRAPPAKIPFTMQAPVASLTDTGEVSVLDHIVLDDVGVYLCVLRRGDDLASLRSRFNSPP